MKTFFAVPKKVIPLVKFYSSFNLLDLAKIIIK